MNPDKNVYSNVQNSNPSGNYDPNSPNRQGSGLDNTQQNVILNNSNPPASLSQNSTQNSKNPFEELIQSTQTLPGALQYGSQQENQFSQSNAHDGAHSNQQAYLAHNGTQQTPSASQIKNQRNDINPQSSYQKYSSPTQQIEMGSTPAQLTGLQQNSPSQQSTNQLEAYILQNGGKQISPANQSSYQQQNYNAQSGNQSLPYGTQALNQQPSGVAEASNQQQTFSSQNTVGNIASNNQSQFAYSSQSPVIQTVTPGNLGISNTKTSISQANTASIPYKSAPQNQNFNQQPLLLNLLFAYCIRSSSLSLEFNLQSYSPANNANVSSSQTPGQPLSQDATSSGYQVQNPSFSQAVSNNLTQNPASGYQSANSANPTTTVNSGNSHSQNPISHTSPPPNSQSYGTPGQAQAATSSNPLNSDPTSNLANLSGGLSSMSISDSKPSTSSTSANSGTVFNTTSNIYNSAPETVKQATVNGFNISSDPNSNVLYGPVLQYVNTDIEKAEWIGSVLMVTDSSILTQTSGQNAQSLVGPSVMIWKDGINIGDPKFADVLPSELVFDDTINNYKFWRVHIKFFLPDINEIPVSYQATLSFQGSTVNSTIYNFCLPSQKTPWRWCCVSNSDAKSSTKAYLSQFPNSYSLWGDLINKHNSLPFHAMVGMGGQINGDDIWKDLGFTDRVVDSNYPSAYAQVIPGSNTSRVVTTDGPLAPFIGAKTKNGVRFNEKSIRKEIPWSQTLETAVSKWYFSRYMNIWFNSIKHGYISRSKDMDMSVALSTIPYMFCIDENDIFPGFGSYGSTISSSPVFRGISAIAIRYWCLFQAHVAYDEIQTNSVKNNSFVSANGQHWIKNIGPFISVVGLDVSTFRSKKQMMSPYAYDDIFRGIEKRVGYQTQQLIICSSIPIIYPTPMHIDSLLIGAKNLGVMGLINYASNRYGGSNKMNAPNNATQNNPYGEPSEDNATNSLGENKILLTLNSQWTSNSHSQERFIFVNRLQSLSNTRPNMRISFISGFVNCCASGKFSSAQDSSPYNGYDLIPENDKKLMIQMISAGITELPMDKLNMKGLTMAGKVKYLDDYTQESFYNLFNVGVDGMPPSDSNYRFLARRSFITMEESTIFIGGQFNTSSTSLVCFIHAEAIPGVNNKTAVKTVSYQIDIPSIQTGSQQQNIYSPSGSSGNLYSDTSMPVPVSNLSQAVGNQSPVLPPRFPTASHGQSYQNNAQYQQQAPTTPAQQQYVATNPGFQQQPGAVRSDSVTSGLSQTTYIAPATTQAQNTINTNANVNTNTSGLRRYPTNPYSGTAQASNEAPPPYSDIDPYSANRR
ncbi:hypothetical protein AYI69_g3394 [Smittium culicis]|uniref:PhoD-like phosphatase domain-containing protein n=1 Tax=Smittium culicis TaxID=133412 RepID=A0A1R1YKD4_9FUNG|nr:hypothetical protein AYI69_g3394 [Smittium culicis]